MCGIAGWLGPGAGTDPSALDRMLETLRLRGPDEAGRFEAPGVALGMRRLAILDLVGGGQPRLDPITGTRLFYNGELYNHRDLRRELESLGHRPRGNSDSEVLLHAWLAWGEDCLPRLNGMFAFAVWQPAERRLYLARDRLGQKPLHYWHDGKSTDDTLLFGSELRTLLAHPAAPRDIDPIALAEYLRLRHVPGPLTMIRGIRQLPPGALLTWRPDVPPAIGRWWQPQFRPDPRLDLAAAVEEFEALWPAVIRRHLISDVPIGAFVSGGIDSGLVAAEAARQMPGFKTFSISFRDSAFDETPHALATARALGCAHEVFPFDADFATLLEEWVRAYDQPFADPAAFPSLILARETRRRVTVALTGDGGDELFAGYQRYRSTLLGRRLTAIPTPLRRLGAATLALAARPLPSHAPSRRWLDAVARRLRLIQPDAAREYISQFWTWEQSQLQRLLSIAPAPPRPTLPSGDLLAAMMTYDLGHWLPDQMLVKMDRATMAHSLEARLPFLDNTLVDLAFRIPAHAHIGSLKLKRVLRAAAARKLPLYLASRPKRGFAVPIDQMLRDNAQSVDDLLSTIASRWPHLFQIDIVIKIWSDHNNGKSNHGERLLALLLFSLWGEQLNL